MNLQKEDLESLRKDVSFLVNTSIGSAKIHKLTLQETKKMQPIRPSMHTLFQAKYGKLKSTILGEVSQIINQKVITEITKPGLVGSVDHKDYVMGQAWDCRNSLMLIDEFDFGYHSENWTTFLQLLEDQKWSRRIAIFPKTLTRNDGDLSFHLEKGKIDLKTRFSAIIATMRRFENQRGDFFKAFISRVVPRRYSIDTAGLMQVAQGERIFLYQETNPDLEITINHKDYSEIVNRVADCLLHLEIPRNSNFAEVKESLFLRTIGDCCRIFAVWNKIDKATIEKICQWKFTTQLSIGTSYGKKTLPSNVQKDFAKQLGQLFEKLKEQV